MENIKILSVTLRLKAEGIALLRIFYFEVIKNSTKFKTKQNTCSSGSAFTQWIQGLKHHSDALSSSIDFTSASFSG